MHLWLKTYWYLQHFLRFCMAPAKDNKKQKCCNLQHFVTFEKRNIVRKMCQNGAFFPILGILRTGGECGEPAEPNYTLASRPLYYTVPEEDLELPVHCIIQCQRRVRSFPSTARGGSGASRPLYYTVPEEDPELPVHCIIQCQMRVRSFSSTARGGSGASRPLYYKVPEEDPELPVRSGASSPLY